MNTANLNEGHGLQCYPTKAKVATLVCSLEFVQDIYSHSYYVVVSHRYT